jgi:ribose 1,5-bisphosphokinase PhnN
MVIGLSGKAGSGKDTVFGYIAEALNVTVMNQKFSHLLKVYASTLLGVDKNKFEDQDFKASVIAGSNPAMTYREFLLEFGTTIMRRVDSDYWVKAAMKKIDENYINVFTDMRFPNELQAVKEYGGISIRVDMVGNEGADHISDKALDNEFFDYTIVAEKGDLQGLKEQVAKILEHTNLIIASV